MKTRTLLANFDKMDNFRFIVKVTKAPQRTVMIPSSLNPTALRLDLL